MSANNILVGQSGGPTAVINSSLYGVIAQGQAMSAKAGRIYGMINGIEGFLSGSLTDLSSMDQESLKLLQATPAAYLGSCRFKLPQDFSSPVYGLLFEKFQQLGIGACLYIGGNDSMDTVDKLHRYGRSMGSSISFIGIPKTIDNDLVETDHTPGYGSAARYVATTLREIALDSGVYRQKSVTIVELMGRHAGWVTAASVLARKYVGDNPLLIYLPESAFDMEQFAYDVENALSQRSDVVICVSEGIKDAHGRFICEYSDEARVDTFGHKMLTGCGKILENYVRDRFGVKVRSVELNVNQRCSLSLASGTDIEEAALAGSFGLKAALEGNSGKMAAFERDSSSPYQMHCCLKDVAQICNQEKPFPSRWITNNGTDIGPEFLEYALPLIQGEPNRIFKNGLPEFLYRRP